MFVVTVVFEVKNKARDTFRAAVLQQARASLSKEEGCRRFDVCFDEANPLRVFLYELYDDPAAFDLHRASEHFARFSATTAPLLESKRVETWQLHTPA